ncbi:MAG: hypothetical protein AAB069_01490 [Planctomycetota bacterium]
MFAAIAKGINADGIELLRIGQQIINTKKIVALELTKHDYSVLNRWQLEQPWKTSGLRVSLNGISEQELVHLRQQMLSCTVENRAKDLLAMNPNWKSAIESADRHKLLQSIL